MKKLLTCIRNASKIIQESALEAMDMKWYCMVNEIKPEHVQDYVDIHENAHKTDWKTQLAALKEA